MYLKIYNFDFKKSNTKIKNLYKIYPKTYKKIIVE